MQNVSNSARQNLSQTYQQRLAEQRAAKKITTQREASCNSNNQPKTNPVDKQQSFISGKPKPV
jgi:predicted chitinase